MFMLLVDHLLLAYMQYSNYWNEFLQFNYHMYWKCKHAI